MAADDPMLDDIHRAGDLGAVEALRVRLLGKSGEITAKLKSLGAMDADTRAAEAPKIHALRETVSSAILPRLEALGLAANDAWQARETADLLLSRNS